MSGRSINLTDQTVMNWFGKFGAQFGIGAEEPEVTASELVPSLLYEGGDGSLKAAPRDFIIDPLLLFFRLDFPISTSFRTHFSSSSRSLILRSFELKMSAAEAASTSKGKAERLYVHNPSTQHSHAPAFQAYKSASPTEFQQFIQMSPANPNPLQQPRNSLEAHALHLRPAPPGRQRPEPNRDVALHTSGRNPQGDRPRRHPVPPQPAPNHLPDHFRPARRAAHAPRADNPPPALQAPPDAQAADQVGAVRAQEGHRQVQHAAGRRTGGLGAPQEARLRPGEGRVGAALGIQG